jgi:peptidoglycan/xylan/chitin deacetylase (PgdA/CDA1 family)
MLKRSVLKLMRATGGFSALRRLNRGQALILTYHRFADKEVEGRISEAQFTEHLRFLKNNHRVLPLAEIVAYLAAGKTLPANTAAITIDDGYRDFYDVAFPLLKRFGTPATFFVITDFLDRKGWLWTDKARYMAERTKANAIEFGGQVFELDGAASRKTVAAAINARLKRMPDEEKEKHLEDLQTAFAVELPEMPPENCSPIDWEQAREMDAAGIGIESHTVSHPILTNVTDERLRRELTDSKRRLREELGREADLFCYPNGGYDQRAKTAVAAAGYKAAVTTDLGFNPPGSDVFELKRADAHPSMIDFEQYASGFELAKTNLRKLRGR